MADSTNPLFSDERVLVFLDPTFRTSPEPTIQLVVVIPQGAARTTDAYAGIAQRTLSRYPEIHRHRCANGRSLGVRNEFANTQVAHLLEHLAIEELAFAGYPRHSLRGETSWDFRRDGQGVYRVALHGVKSEDAEVAVVRTAARSLVELMCG